MYSNLKNQLVPRSEHFPSQLQACNVTYNVTLRRVRATIVVMERQLILHILSVCL